MSKVASKPVSEKSKQTKRQSKTYTQTDETYFRK